MEKKEIRWGLLGAGIILDRWMKGARQVEDMNIVAISSRTMETAKKMAERFDIPEAITYDEMIARNDIDVVYIPVPHPGHKEPAIRAMNSGKSVLVEKPAGVGAAEAEEMIARAKKNNVFFMEAVWTRFFPIIDMIKARIGEKGIGEVRAMHSSFAYRIPDDCGGRLVDPATAGGGLLDVGVYNLHFSRMIFEKDPVALTGLMSMNTDHLHLMVDEQESYIAQYDNGALSVMTNAIRTEIPDTAYIYGTKGRIIVPSFWKPSEAQVIIGDQEETIKAPVPQKIEGVEDEGYQFEIAYVNDCLRKGIKESPLMPWEATLSVLKQCDKLRNDWNYKYPFE
ncbi:MAG: Gfo/Idh/MocA family oxidoreductase [Clostridiales bacterium]|nr:Gfo/Idh/MocA family oxidoreductase [Candidatus Blautia equi]